MDGGDVATIRQRCLGNVRAVVECGQHMGSQHHWSPFCMSRAAGDHAARHARCSENTKVSLSVPVCTEPFVRWCVYGLVGCCVRVCTRNDKDLTWNEC